MTLSMAAAWGPEVRVNVINQPYGGFPWLDLPQAANENWYNAHNFYGELSDLEAATLEDVADFFDTFYAPNNAVVVVVGDVDADEVMGWVEEYFGGIERADVPPIQVMFHEQPSLLVPLLCFCGLVSWCAADC